jgi:hypothetical protein
VRYGAHVWVLGLGLFSLSGCAGEEAFINLELRGFPSAIKAVPPQDGRLKVAVTPFEDARVEPGPIGTRRGLGWRETPFHVLDVELGEAVALVLIDELKSRKGWDAWLAKPGVTAPESGPDVTINGQIVKFVANAGPWYGLTEMTVDMELAVQALDVRDGTEVRLVLAGDGSRPSLFFGQKAMEDLLNAALRESLKKLLEETKVENQGLRLKQAPGLNRGQPAGNPSRHRTDPG